MSTTHRLAEITRGWDIDAAHDALALLRDGVTYNLNSLAADTPQLHAALDRLEDLLDTL